MQYVCGGRLKCPAKWRHPLVRYHAQHKPPDHPPAHQPPTRELCRVKQHHIRRVRAVICKTVAQAPPNGDHLGHRLLQRAAGAQLRQLAVLDANLRLRSKRWSVKIA